MNKLGDQGVDLIFNAYLENFEGGGPKTADLPLSEEQ
jgi:hypothetical protein